MNHLSALGSNGFDIGFDFEFDYVSTLRFFRFKIQCMTPKFVSCLKFHFFFLPLSFVPNGAQFSGPPQTNTENTHKS